MKRILIALTVLLLLTLCLPGLAEGERAFTLESIPAELPRVDEWSWRGASQFVVVGDSVYAFYPRDGGILRWAPGEEGAACTMAGRSPSPCPRAAAM